MVFCFKTDCSTCNIFYFIKDFKDLLYVLYYMYIKTIFVIQYKSRSFDWQFVMSVFIFFQLWTISQKIPSRNAMGFRTFPNLCRAWRRPKSPSLPPSKAQYLHGSMEIFFVMALESLSSEINSKWRYTWAFSGLSAPTPPQKKKSCTNKPKQQHSIALVLCF